MFAAIFDNVCKASLNRIDLRNAKLLLLIIIPMMIHVGW
jgi:hypothetical protein